MEKIRTILWFLKKPYLFPQLFYQVKQTLFPHPKEGTKNESTKWCIENQVTTAKALKTIGGIGAFEKIDNLYHQEFADAEKKVLETPVQMGGGGNCELLYYLVLYAKPTLALETGVAYGWSSMSILLGLEENGYGQLTSTDMPYAKMNNEDYVGCVVPKHLKKRWTLMRKPDRQAIPKFLKENMEVQLVHYDSDKSYRGRMWAYERLWKKLSVGGIFVSDDIGDNIAFKEFSEEKNLKPVVVEFENKHIGILIKDG